MGLKVIESRRGCELDHKERGKKGITADFVMTLCSMTESISKGQCRVD